MPRKPQLNPDPLERWKRWPRSPDVREWMLALLRLADFMDSPSEIASSTVEVALSELAVTGSPSEAMEQVEHIHGLLPSKAADERSSILETGAEIAFDSSDFDRMESFLQRLLDLQPLFTRKCDRNCQMRQVKRFKALRGLLPPEEVDDPREQIEASFQWNLRMAQDATRQGKSAVAIQSLEQARLLTKTMPDWMQRHGNETLAVAFSEVGDRKHLKSILAQDDLADHRTRISPRVLLKIKERSRAIRRLEREVDEALSELKSRTMNAHFPAIALKAAICQLVDLGELKHARASLKRTLKEGKAWLLPAPGAFTSAVFRSIAETVARVEGREHALSLLQVAIQRADADRKSNWRSAAIRENAELLIDLSPPEDALKIASQIRSRNNRNELLAKLHARHHRWGELHSILNACKTPMQAAETIWWMKFEWRPAQ